MSLFSQNARASDSANGPEGEVPAPVPAHDGSGLDIPAVGADVIDSQGVYASVVAVHPPGMAGSGVARGLPSDVLVLMAAGQEVRLPRSLLQRETDHVYRVPFAFATLAESPECNGAVHVAPADTLVVPVLEESLQVTTRLVDTGRGVRLHKTVLETPHTVEQALLREEFMVEHVQQDRVVDESNMPQAHYEGDTLIIPVLEEVLVVQKQVRMKQEIRVTRVQRSVPGIQTVILRSEQVRIERFDENKAGKS